MIDFDKLRAISPSYDIVFLAVFGSAARGELSSQSDLDLLVRFKTRKSLLQIVRIERELSETLGVQVDLLTEKAISPYIREKIQPELKVIYDEG